MTIYLYIGIDWLKLGKVETTTNNAMSLRLPNRKLPHLTSLPPFVASFADKCPEKSISLFFLLMFYKVGWGHQLYRWTHCNDEDSACRQGSYDTEGEFTCQLKKCNLILPTVPILRRLPLLPLSTTIKRCKCLLYNIVPTFISPNNIIIFYLLSLL